MIHPATQIREVSEQVGIGVFAKQHIPAGTIVYVQDRLDVVFPAGDPILTHPDYADLIEKYSFTDEKGDYVMSWDHSKYVNHSCRPNTLSTAWGFDIAVEDILPGEQMTCEYGVLNIDREMECLCGDPKCRLVIEPSDIHYLGPQWDERIRRAMAFMHQVDQPLQKYLPMEVLGGAMHFVSTGEGYRPVETMLWKPPVTVTAGQGNGQ